jgi:uncharacterized protein
MRPIQFLFALSLVCVCAGIAAEAQAPAIRWRTWGPEAFAEAREQDRPIALYVEARWNHYDQVFQADVLTDAEVVTLLNDECIPVRVDRDRQPDVDAHYQEATRAFSGSGGWPLSVFLTPDGEALIGGVFYELEDEYIRERPGYRTVLRHVILNWRKNRDEVRRKAREFDTSLREKPEERPTPAAPPTDLLDRVATSTRRAFRFQAEHDGPRFPQSCAAELLLAHAARSGDRASLLAATEYLDGMLRGGIYDRVGGGFHRAAQDKLWRKPRFEKLLTTNAEMIGLCLDAWQATGEEAYARAARESLRWPGDDGRGGFYASQAASVDARDPGRFYTWTVRELEHAVENNLLCRYACQRYDIGEWGDLPETAPHRNVLFLAKTPREAAQAANVAASRADELDRAVLNRLRAARHDAPSFAPPVDRAILVDDNASMARVWLRASALPKEFTDADDEPAPAHLGPFARKTLDRLLKDAVDPQRGAAHVIEPDGTVRHPCLASDEAALALAAQDAYLATGEARYLEAAGAALARLDERFRDPQDGAYWDRAMSWPAAPPALGRLSDPHKPITDTPQPSVNAQAVMAHLRQGVLTGEAQHAELAHRTLEAFGGVLENLGPSAAALTLAADAAQNGCVLVLVEGAAGDAGTTALLAAAARIYAPHKMVLRVDAGDQATLRRLGAAPGAADALPLAHVLAGKKALAPTGDPKALQEALRSAARP